jgi:type I restriction enzyme S subunit
MRHRFEDIAINSTAKKKPTTADKDTYLGLEHLDSGSLTVTRFGSEVAPIGDTLIMRKGEVLFGKRRAYQKKVAIAPFDGIFSAHGMVLRPKEEVIDKNFFPLFISSDYFLDSAIKISVGSLSPTINWSTLRELKFELPSLDEQKRLAEVLWAATEVKTAYKELLSLTEQLMKSQFVEMFGDVFFGSEKYPKQPIVSIVDNDIAKIGRVNANSDTIKYIDISSIDNSMNEIVQYTDYLVGVSPSRAQQVVQYGDVLVSTVRPNLKNVAVIRDDFENLVASTGFCVLRPTNETNTEYLFAIVSSNEFADYLARRAKGANYPAVNGSDIKEFEIPVPPVSLQNQFAEFVRQADKSKFELGRAIDDLEATYKAILREKLG